MLESYNIYAVFSTNDNLVFNVCVNIYRLFRHLEINTLINFQRKEILQSRKSDTIIDLDNVIKWQCGITES